jgi:hypothetical protein
MKYTVILAYPLIDDKIETYIEFTEAADPITAEQNVRNMASEANYGDIEPEEFALVAVFKGRHKPQ